MPVAFVSGLRLRATRKACATTLAAVTASAVTLVAGPASAAESTTSDLDYVALGDSYTAGPLIPYPTGPVGCGRSTQNYPHMVAEEIDPDSFVDNSCSGATTENMTEPQDIAFGTHPPQFEALSADTDLVTIGIGGNDIGFADIAVTCARLDFYRPHGNRCEEYYTRNGVDVLAQRIEETAPEIAGVLQGIHERAPEAEVFLVGYPVILPDEGDGCWPEVPISSGDVPYLRSIEKQLNDMLAEQAAANGATYVDTYTSSIGHGVCQPDSDEWVEGYLPSDIAFPVHPNEDGMENTAEQVLAAIE